MDFPGWSVATIGVATGLLGALTKLSLPVFGFVSNHEKALWAELQRRELKYEAEITACRVETAACRAETAACRAEMSRLTEMHETELSRTIGKYEVDLEKLHKQKHDSQNVANALLMKVAWLMMELNKTLETAGQPVKYSELQIQDCANTFGINLHPDAGPNI